MAYLNVMTRIDGRKDDDLLYDLGGREHPTVLFLDAEGAVLGRQDPEGTTVQELEETGAKVKRSLDLKKKADAGDKGATTDLAIVQCDLGVIEFSDLEAAIEGMALTPEQERAVGVLRADSTVGDMMQVLRKNPDEATKSMVAEEFLALHKTGAQPARPANRRFYWAVLAGQAVAKKDAAMLKEAISGLRAVASAVPSEHEARQLKELEERLLELEAAK